MIKQTLILALGFGLGFSGLLAGLARAQEPVATSVPEL